MRLRAIFILLSIALSGCATIGPMVNSDEIKGAREELEVKALAYQIEQLVKVNNIGYWLLKSLPEKDWKGKFPYLGILSMPINKRLCQLYKISPAQGLVIIGVVENSPADEAGLKEGDILLTLNGERLTSPFRFRRAKRRIVPGEAIALELKRDQDIIKKSIVMGSIPVRVKFDLVDLQELNATATRNGVYLTYGLVRFTKSDDEIAIILAHELVHIVQGHHIRSMGLGIFSDLVAVTLGVTAEAAQSGSGEAVLRSSALLGDIFNTYYSRDLEREADYLGLKYAYLAGYDIEAGAQIWERFIIEMPRSMVDRFLSTHPTSPERLIRIQKTIAEIKGEKSQEN